jgi:signal transduction histidine kinase
MSSTNRIEQHQEPISVSSDVLARLGEELITNHIQALAELIKNAYDADATVVKVIIDTQAPVALTDNSAVTGRITVADNGTGMDETAVRRGWLRVSASPKRAMKERGEKTAKNRTPLGDKGLGRLGAQRLGDRVRIRTRPQSDLKNAKVPAVVEHDVSFAFTDFSTDLDVTDITVPWRIANLPEQAELVEPWPLNKPTGTVVEISGLRETNDWGDTTELERALSLLTNPFKGVGRFSLSVTVDGTELNLESVAENVRRAALTRWEGTFDGDLLTIEGSVRLNWFGLRDADDQQQLDALVQSDKGTGLRRFVVAALDESPFKATAGASPWLISLSREFRLSDVDNFEGLAMEPVDKDAADGGEAPGEAPPAGISAASDGALGGDEFPETDEMRPVSPGEFLFELDTVSRRIGVAQASGLSALDRQSEYTKWLNARGGIHVYRDGFRINLGSDVMRLGEAFSSSSSYYGLRPQNVIGYIEISAEHNRGLEETTDREGFRETPEVINFEWLLRKTRDEINAAFDVLGRSAGGYLRSQVAQSGESTEELADELTASGKAAAEAKSKVAAAGQQVSEALAGSATDVEAKGEALRAAAEALGVADEALERSQSAAEIGVVVRRDVAELKERVEEYAQLIGLGLVAETMAHELNHVSARLRGQIQDMESRVTDLPPWARAYLQESRSALDALYGHLRHLDPMLRYARARRTAIPLAAFAEEMAAYHRPRLEAERIKLTVSADEPATVRANRGRLMQVFDNLILNSEYWLQQALKAGRLERGQISVEARDTTLSFRDNGPGVDLALEPTIFEPFVTGKGKQGRGLGLFICRQLLDMDNGRIALAEPRNSSGRAHTFEVSFDEAEAGGE